MTGEVYSKLTVAAPLENPACVLLIFHAFTKMTYGSELEVRDARKSVDEGYKVLLHYSQVVANSRGGSGTSGVSPTRCIRAYLGATFLTNANGATCIRL